MIKRSILRHIEEALEIFPVVLLTGARQVGKSTLALSLREHYITLDDITQLDGAKTDPERFIQELPRPVVIDEIQKAPELLPAIKAEVDRCRSNGDFLLTGSANLLGYQKVAESLAGRMGVIELWPLSCKEISEQAEQNIIDELFLGNGSKQRSSPFPPFTLKRVIQGGYPELQKIDSTRGRSLWLSSYVSTYIERDIREIGELRHIDRFIHLLNIVASRSANLINKAELSRSAAIEQKTVENYLMLLEMVYQIERLKPYSKNLGKRYTRAPKLHFTDSGVLCHLLGIDHEEALRTSPYYGAVIEAYVFSELLKGVRYSSVPTRMWHYRTSDQQEIDFLIERGELCMPVEVKAAKTVRKRDFSHIESLQGRDPTIGDGVIFYLGDDVVPFGRNHALPIAMLC